MIWEGGLAGLKAPSQRQALAANAKPLCRKVRGTEGKRRRKARRTTEVVADLGIQDKSRKHQTVQT